MNKVALLLILEGKNILELCLCCYLGVLSKYVLQKCSGPSSCFHKRKLTARAVHMGIL